MGQWHEQPCAVRAVPSGGWYPVILCCQGASMPPPLGQAPTNIVNVVPPAPAPACACRAGESSITVLRSPRSRASLLHLGAFHNHLDTARARAALHLAGLAPRRRPAAAAAAAVAARRAGGSVTSGGSSRVRAAGARVAAAKKELEVASSNSSSSSSSGPRVVAAAAAAVAVAAAASGGAGAGVEVDEGAARRAAALAASLEALTAERVWAARHMQL